MPNVEIICPISEKQMSLVFSATVLKKYVVNYYYCEESGLLKSEKPYWLDEAYKEAIADTDTGLVQRNIANSSWLELIIQILFSGQGAFLDVSGGYGLLARLMRDKGFDFYTIDKYCKNLFASYFEPLPGFKADALCAFEVLEHVEDPLHFMADVFEKYSCRTIIFSTVTFSNDTIPHSDWWYYSFETGQHITFYQPRTLERLARKLGSNYYGITQDMHIITDKNLSKASRLFIFNPYIREIYSFYLRNKRKGISKTWEDHLLIKAKLK